MSVEDIFGRLPAADPFVAKMRREIESAGGFAPTSELVMRDAAVEAERRLADAMARVERRDALSQSGGPLELMNRLIEYGVPADVGRPLTFKGREFWKPIYGAIDQPRFVVMSSAQVGKTIMLLYGLALLPHLFYYRGTGTHDRGIWQGLYMPTMEMVRIFSKGRLDAILRAIGRHTGIRCGNAVTNDVPSMPFGDNEDDRNIRDSYNFKRIGASFVYLAWMGGMLRDALPLDVVWFDEVRMMDGGDVDRVEQRVQGSKHGFMGYTSTAGLPGDAIDVRWERSDQRYFHHYCRCPGGVVLNLAWPNCLREQKADDPRDRYYLACPRCNARIEDRAYGRWIAHNRESGFYPGFNPNQLMTEQPLWRIAEKWHRVRDGVANRADFFNSVLGMNYLDEGACPITIEVLRSAINTDLIWCDSGRRTCMGIDQMGGNNYFVIAEKTPDGSRRLLHLEIVWSDNPFQRAAELMRLYDVSVCCLEGLPNYNDAIQFANAFKGRVFVVSYSAVKNAIVRWGDRPEEGEQSRKAGDQGRTRWTAAVDRDKMLDMWSTHWTGRFAEMPQPAALEQRVMHEDGGEFLCPIGRDVYCDHLRRLAKRRITEKILSDGIDMPEETGVVRYKWIKLARAPGTVARPAAVRGAASDPHFAFADALCVLAWTRTPASKEGRVHVYY